MTCLDENLVPNPSFEKYKDCTLQTRPFSLSGVVADWEDFPKFGNAAKDAKGLSDFYHVDCPFQLLPKIDLIPQNKPRTGKGMIGQFLMQPTSTSPRTNENPTNYTATLLKKPLVKGKKYKYRFYTKLGVGIWTSPIDRVNLLFTVATPNNFFTSIPTIPELHYYIGKPPTLKTPLNVAVGDTAFWTRIEGVFKADSAYKYLMVGNYFKFDETRNFDPIWNETAYYLFDDFYVQELLPIAFKWTKADTIVCKNGTARLNFTTEADSVTLKNTKTGERGPLSIGAFELPNITEKTCFEVYLKKGICTDTISFCAYAQEKIDTAVVEKTCRLSDTGVVMRRLLTQYGCDSTVTVRKIFSEKDTTILATLASCNPKDTGLVVKNLKNKYNCDSIVFQKTRLLSPIMVDIGSNQQRANGTQLQLNAQTTGDSVVSIAWMPPTGLTCSDCKSPQVFLTKSVSYVVSVVGKAGCLAMDTLQLTVVDSAFAFVPNVFSPNNDQNNDVLTVFASSSRVKNVARFSIYDRWGNRVFSNQNFPPNDKTQGWNGTLNGVELPPDVFVYVLELTLFDDSRVIMSGDVTLIK
jgi:gliding motility-associated-like protein